MNPLDPIMILERRAIRLALMGLWLDDVKYTPAEFFQSPCHRIMWQTILEHARGGKIDVAHVLVMFCDNHRSYYRKGIKPLCVDDYTLPEVINSIREKRRELNERVNRA